MLLGTAPALLDSRLFALGVQFLLYISQVATVIRLLSDRKFVEHPEVIYPINCYLVLSSFVGGLTTLSSSRRGW